MGSTALIVGASGLIGHELLQLLLQHSGYEKITAVVRTSLDVVHPKLEQRVIDFEQLHALPEELIRNSDLFCTLGTTMRKAKTKSNFLRVDYEYPMTLGRLAQRYGAAQLLIVTALGADSGSRFFYNQVKGKVEEDLKQLSLPSLRIFQPSLLLGERQEFRLGERISMSLAKRLSFVFAGKLGKYKPVAAAAVAKAMLHEARMRQRGTRTYTSDEIFQLATEKQP
ncbi:MAG: NAD-dependent epimerase [Paenibacillus sp.]|nr:NAD-dependent epimerase [Paenibacillus sp.]